MSSTANIISQRTISGGPVFRFNDRYLEYFGPDWDFKIKYEETAGPSQYRRTQTTDRLSKYTFFYFFFIGFLLLVTSRPPDYAEGWQWFIDFRIILIVGAAICGLLYYFTHKEFTVVPCRQGNILVVIDNRHDAITEKLQAARLKSLRELSAPNPANSPAEEWAKLKWLHDEGAITHDEYMRLSTPLAPNVPF